MPPTKHRLDKHINRCGVSFKLLLKWLEMLKYIIIIINPISHWGDGILGHVKTVVCLKIKTY